MTFALHPQLAADTQRLISLPLCELLLSNDARYPWTILVPRRAGVEEIIDLTDADQLQLLRESSALSRAMRQVFGDGRLNVAKLGNQVPQLHLHHIVRNAGDDAWPGPIWGKHPALRYADGEQLTIGRELLAALSADTQIST